MSRLALTRKPGQRIMIGEHATLEYRGLNDLNQAVIKITIPPMIISRALPPGGSIDISREVTVYYVHQDEKQAKILIEAPERIKILREEVMIRDMAQNGQ